MDSEDIMNNLCYLFTLAIALYGCEKRTIHVPSNTSKQHENSPEQKRKLASTIEKKRKIENIYVIMDTKKYSDSELDKMLSLEIPYIYQAIDENLSDKENSEVALRLKPILRKTQGPKLKTGPVGEKPKTVVWRQTPKNELIVDTKIIPDENIGLRVPRRFSNREKTVEVSAVEKNSGRGQKLLNDEDTIEYTPQRVDDQSSWFIGKIEILE